MRRERDHVAGELASPTLDGLGLLLIALASELALFGAVRMRGRG